MWAACRTSALHVLESQWVACLRLRVWACVRAYRACCAYAAHLLRASSPPDEVAIIKGALDMTHKTARHCMTPIDMVFMLPTDAVLDEETLTAIMASGVCVERGGGGRR